MIPKWEQQRLAIPVAMCAICKRSTWSDEQVGVLLPDGETVHNAFFGPGFQGVKIKYFADTDTLYIEFKPATVAETRDLDENTVLDVDADGNICAMTIEHASVRAGAPEMSYERVPT